MQKKLKYFLVHYLQKQFYPLNPCPLGKLQQYPPIGRLHWHKTFRFI